MRKILQAIAALVLLTSCQTTIPDRKPIPIQPLNVAKSNGAVSLKLCFGKPFVATLLSTSVHRISPKQNRIARSAIEGKHFRSVLSLEDMTFAERGRACKMWQFQTRPGIYAITEVGSKIKGASSADLSLGLRLIYNPENKWSHGFRLTRFVDEFGAVQENTPIFEVRDGEITRLGTLTFDTHEGFRHVPIKDSAGNWDGVTTNMVADNTEFLKYEEPSPTEPDNGAPIAGHVSRVSLQPLVSLTGRETLLIQPD